MYKSLSNEELCRATLKKSTQPSSFIKHRMSVVADTNSMISNETPHDTQVFFLGKRDSTAAEDIELDTNIVRLNVGGQIFMTSKETLRRYPHTLLGSLSPNSRFFNRRKREYFFDRNATVFAGILDLYRSKELHLPRNICGNAAVRELEFWGVPAIWVSACCWNNIHDAIRDQRQHQDLKSSNDSLVGPFRLSILRVHLWHLLYDRRRKTVCFHIMTCFLLLLITSTMVLFFLNLKSEITPHEYFRKYLATNCSHCTGSPPPRRRHDLWVADISCLAVLMAEFMMKLALCPRPMRFLKSMLNMMYGTSLLVSVIAHIVNSVLETPDNWTDPNMLDALYSVMHGMHFLRVVRIFELLDINASLHVMWIAVTSCRSELFLLLIVFIVLAAFFGVFAFFFENRATSEKKGSSDFPGDLANSVYWAIITMTTVGYGDMTPSTPLGRVVGSLCSVCGVIVLALPVAILTESFQQYNLRQKIQMEKRKRQDEYLYKSRNSVWSDVSI